jgi:YVTN family beta-propeller protein
LFSTTILRIPVGVVLQDITIKGEIKQGLNMHTVKLKNNWHYRIIIYIEVSLLLLSYISMSSASDNVDEITAGIETGVLATIPIGLGGHGPYDIAANSATNRIYVFNQGSNNISVIDSVANKIISTVRLNERSTSKIAVNSISNKIYVAGFFAIVVIDGNSNLIVETIKLNPPTNGFLKDIDINESTNRIYVTFSRTIIVIDGSTNTVIQTLSFDDEISSAGVNPVTNLIYVTGETVGNSNLVTVLDGTTNNIKTKIQVPGTFFITGAAVNPATNRIYVAEITPDSQKDRIIVIDGNTNNITTSIAVKNPTYEISVAPKTNRIYLLSENRKNSLSSLIVVDSMTDTVLSEISLQPLSSVYPRKMTINGNSGNIYLTNINGNTVSVIDASGSRLIANLLVGNQPTAININPNTGHVYIANFSANTVSVIDRSSNKIVKTIQVGKNPIDIAVNPVTNRIYVVNNGSSTISIIDGASDTVIGDMIVGASPIAAAVNPDTNRLYVIDTDDRSRRVSVYDGISNSIIAAVRVVAARGVAVNPKTNRVYVPFSSSFGTDNGTVVIDGSSNMIIATPRISTRNYPKAVAINPITNRIYVTDSPEPGNSGGGLFVIDGETNTFITKTATFPGQLDVDVDIANNIIYLSNNLIGSVLVIDGATNKTISNVKVGKYPNGIVFDSVTNRLYIADEVEDTVSVLGDKLSPIDMITPSVKITLPNGGEVLKAGTSTVVTWQSSDNTSISSHEILLSTDGGTSFPKTLATGIFGTDRSFAITLPKELPKTGKARIRVIAIDASGNKGMGDSSNNFKIKKAKR